MSFSIEKSLAVMNKLQEKFVEHHKLSESDKNLWAASVQNVRQNGYALRKKSVKNEYGRKIKVVWYAVPESTAKRSKNFTAQWKKIDMRPNDGLTTCKGDCTTRAMAYCLKGVSSYREIENEQYRFADEANRAKGLRWGDGRAKVHRNTNGVWDKVMLNHGYVWVRFKKKIRRDNLAAILQDLTYPAITNSSGHVAAIFHGNVIDTWDSRHGRCDRILVKSSEQNLVSSKIA